MTALRTRAANGQDTKCHDGVLGDVVILCAEEEIRDVIAYWLTSLPARTVVAEDGYHAAKLMQNGCRWLFTDRVLPPWPGLDTFLSIRAHHPRLRIAYVENGTLHDGILARVTGANVLLQRPLTRQAVVDAITRTEPRS
jgi:twitching motility two-component system response regulator PilG